MDEGIGGERYRMLFCHSRTRLLSILPSILNSTAENLYEHSVSKGVGQRHAYYKGNPVKTPIIARSVM